MAASCSGTSPGPRGNTKSGVLAPDLVTVRFGGESLTDFFTSVTAPSAALVLGPGAEPLASRFEGFSEATLARSVQADP